MSASVVSCVDSSPVFEAGEHVLDSVALSVEYRIVAMPDAVTAVRRDARGDASRDERLAEADGTEGSIGQQVLGLRQVLEHCGGGLVVVGLAFAQMQQQRASLAVADHLQLAGQTASTASDTSG